MLPVASDWIERSKPLTVFCMLTIAPGIAFPCGSVTCPVTEPESVWALAAATIMMNGADAERMRLNRRELKDMGASGSMKIGISAEMELEDVQRERGALEAGGRRTGGGQCNKTGRTAAGR